MITATVPKTETKARKKMFLNFPTAGRTKENIIKTTDVLSRIGCLYFGVWVEDVDLVYYDHNEKNELTSEEILKQVAVECEAASECDYYVTITTHILNELDDIASILDDCVARSKHNPYVSLYVDKKERKPRTLIVPINENPVLIDWLSDVYEAHDSLYRPANRYKRYN